jgi:hypothetical protein
VQSLQKYSRFYRLWPEGFYSYEAFDYYYGSRCQESRCGPHYPDALCRELALFETRERLVLSEIEDMEQKYGMTSSEFWNKFESGALGDDQDYFVWWSLTRGLEAVRT